MNTPIDKQDEALLRATRNAVSRHQEIPPTPRDTMAVLMAAANKESVKKSTPAFTFVRWAAGCAVALLLVVSINMFRDSDKSADLNTVAHNETGIVDLGLDVAAWDMEIEALFDELDESFLAYSYETY